MTSQTPSNMDESHLKLNDKEKQSEAADNSDANLCRISHETSVTCLYFSTSRETLKRIPGLAGNLICSRRTADRCPANIGALIITNTILGTHYDNYSIVGP